MINRLLIPFLLLISSCLGRETGLTPDAYITSSEKEHIEAGRRLNEAVHTEHKEDHTVFNPCLAELLTLDSQVSEFKRVQSHFMTQRLYEGESMDVVREEVKEIDEKTIAEIQETKRKVIENRKKTEEKINKILPQQQVSEDRLENLYEAIYSDQTQPEKLVEFIGEMRSAEAKEQRLIAEQKAKIAASKTLGARAKKFLEKHAERELAQTEREIEAAVNVTPFARSIMDAEAQYEAGAMSGSEAAMKGLQNVAVDAVTMAATLGIIKCGSSIVKAGGKALWKAVTKTPASTQQLEKLGLNISKENFKIDWKNPDVMNRGMQYENLVVNELETQGFLRLAPNTNTFDAFNLKTGHAVSIKSLDTQTSARLKNLKQIEYLMNSYVRKVKNFSGIKESAKQFKITPESVEISEIRIGVPKDTTLEQWLTMQKSATKAEQQGVKITFGVEE
jgi:hypothetical protein